MIDAVTAGACSRKSRVGQMGTQVEITRRQLFGAGMGLAGSGLLEPVTTMRGQPSRSAKPQSDDGSRQVGPSLPATRRA